MSQIERHTRGRVVTADEARQGESTGHVRHVLRASLLLAVIAGAVLYVLYGF
jgi:hypothetical protein